jgi:anti-sigma factor RsiW
MSERDSNTVPPDEMLVAYIDGELNTADRDAVEAMLCRDKRTKERLDLLGLGDPPFHEAFQSMLEAAPTARLEAMLEAIQPLQARPERHPQLRRRGFLAAAAAGLVAAGIGMDRTVTAIMTRFNTPDESAEWRAVVAEYLSLYSADTLSGPGEDRGAQAAQLAVVGARLGLPLTPESVALPGVDFRRAQVLQYDGKPLAQIVYLDPETGPMALCLVLAGGGPAEPNQERRQHMNVVYWSTATHAFMLIGHSTIDQLQALADHLRGTLPA